MMTKKKETRGFSNFGFSTILLSFVMICVVTFSALSLITAYSDFKLSKKVADKNQCYYEAETKAYEKLMAIDQILVECYQNSINEADYYSKAQIALAEYSLAFLEPISEDHYLSVEIAVHYPQNDTECFYEIIQWKSVYEKESPEDEHLNLISKGLE